MRKTHVLKIWPEEFLAVVNGLKTAEFRINDREFNVGDKLILKEFEPYTSEYTGDEVSVRVRYINYGPRFGIPEGYVMMSIS